MSTAVSSANSFPPAAIRLLPDPGTGQPVDRSEPGLLRCLSASRLKCWQSCRRQFYYRYVERLVVPTAPALFRAVFACLIDIGDDRFRWIVVVSRWIPFVVTGDLDGCDFDYVSIRRPGFRGQKHRQ